MDGLLQVVGGAFKLSIASTKREIAYLFAIGALASGARRCCA